MNDRMTKPVADKGIKPRDVRITKDISAGVRVNGLPDAGNPSSGPEGIQTPKPGPYVLSRASDPRQRRPPAARWISRERSSADGSLETSLAARRSTPLPGSERCRIQPNPSAGVARPSALAVPPEPPRAAPVVAGSAFAVDRLHPRRRGWGGLIRSRGWRAGTRGQGAYREGCCGNCHGNFSHRNSLISIGRTRKITVQTLDLSGLYPLGNSNCSGQIPPL
jgi:hypothetical protein